MTCENQISTEDLINADSDAVTLGEVATSRTGAKSGGAPITQSTNRFGETTDTVQGRLNKLGVLFDDPIKDWSASLLVSDLRAHRFPATTGDIYIPVKPLPFTTGATFNTSDWELYNGFSDSQIDLALINDLSQEYEFDIRGDMEISTIVFPVNKTLTTKGFSVVGDGGGATYTNKAGSSPESVGSPDLLGSFYADLRIKNKKVTAEQVGMTNTGDSSAAIQAMFDIGVSIKGVNEYNIDTIIATSSNNIGLLGGKYNIGALAVGATAIRIFGNDCKFKGVEFDGGDNELAQVIRTEKGAKNPKILSCKFKNFYSTGWLWVVRIETDDGGSFLCHDLEFENITCLKNDSIGDTNGSVRCIRTNTEDSGSSNPTGGTISKILMRNVNTVASKGGAPVLEDADGLQIGGRNDNPVTVKDIVGYDIGKRLVKVQTRKVSVSNIKMFANQALAHEAVLEFFDGDLTFNKIQGYGNIKAIVASGTQDHSGTVGTNVVLKSTYTAVSPVSQPGAIDIKGGSDIDISGIEVTGGVNGLRITIEGDGVPIDDVRIKGNFDVSGYGCLVRNINNAESITNLTLSDSKFKSNSADVRNVSFETTGGRVIKTVKMRDMTFDYSGTQFENVKSDTVDDLMVSGIFNTSTQAIPLRVTNGNDLEASSISEQTSGRSVPVVSVALCNRVNVAGVKSDFSATGSIGMVTFEGVDMGYVSTAIPASPAATAVAFKDSGITLCTNCVNQTVNATVFKQGGYTDANAIDINDKLNP